MFKTFLTQHENSGDSENRPGNDPERLRIGTTERRGAR
jgi:hypothetical protein